MKQSKHLKYDNKIRYEFIKHNIGFGRVIQECFWNKGHKDGAEMHFVTDTGIVVITNCMTRKIVTYLIARPEQIKRYYRMREMEAPKWLLDIAEYHKEQGWNLI